MAYSVRCAAFRTKNWTCAIASGEMSGHNQRKKGAMIREVCSADIRSVEAKKITPNQITIGSQYLKNDFIRRSVSFALANPQSTIFLLP